MAKKTQQNFACVFLDTASSIGRHFCRTRLPPCADLHERGVRKIRPPYFIYLHDSPHFLIENSCSAKLDFKLLTYAVTLHMFNKFDSNLVTCRSGTWPRSIHNSRITKTPFQNVEDDLSNIFRSRQKFSIWVALSSRALALQYWYNSVYSVTCSLSPLG